MGRDHCVRLSCFVVPGFECSPAAALDESTGRDARTRSWRLETLCASLSPSRQGRVPGSLRGKPLRGLSTRGNSRHDHGREVVGELSWKVRLPRFLEPHKAPGTVRTRNEIA